ncbi:translocation/assembly module TamB [Elizabethkingia sp. JS20170427COW]|uniref:translocation/assembly module TamB domain-containing protein n=1 Tax=Elizabethkingia sp. JS20170427COW TaxID=2583851 RepID=UPI0011104F62|nr:translocation/assembly module TamB [Elizabethkingia sp. JS20170427COW]QCX52385.1 translocation/assembly module TamB [Elizabethkingia sp. JS20170427COW]
MANLDNNKENNDKNINNPMQQSNDESPKASESKHDSEVVDKILPPKKYSVWAKIILTMFYAFLGIVVLLMVVVNLPVTQNYATTKVLNLLNKDLKINISKEDISINLFGDVKIKGIEIKDDRGYPLIRAKELKAASNWFALLKSTNQLGFDNLTLVEPDVRVVTYKGDSIDNFTRFIQKFDNGKPRDPNKPPFQLNARIQIQEGKISIHNQNSGGEEGRWLRAYHVNLFVTKFHVKGPDISARIRNFSMLAYRRNHKFLLDTFSGDFSLTQEALSFKGLTLNTENTLLMGDLVFNLDKKTKFQDFANKVRWDLHLKKGSRVSGADIHYFMPRWDNKNGFAISGKMTGPLNNFKLDDFSVQGKEVSIYSPETKMKNLLKGNFNIQTREFSADFTYPQLRAMLPSFIAKKLGNFADVFGRIKYKGNANVTPEKVIADGSLVTTIGQADISSLTLTEFSTPRPKYIADVLVKDLNTTAFTKNKTVGLLSGKINLQGEGFDVNTLSLKTHSDIYRLELMGKDIHQLKIDGTLNHKVFQGKVAVDDNYVKANLDGKVDFSTPRLLMDARTEINHVDLQYFGINPQSKSTLSGVFEGKLSMKDINDLNLDFKLNEVKLLSNKQNIIVPDGSVKAFIEGKERIVSVNAPGVVQGEIRGKYNLGDLSNMMMNGLNGILAGYRPPKYYKNQQLNFSFDIQQGLLEYFVPEIKISRGAYVQGSYQGDNNALVLDSNIQNMQYLISKKKEPTASELALAKANPDYKIDFQPIVTDTVLVNNFKLNVNTANQENVILADLGRLQFGKTILSNYHLQANKDLGNILHLKSDFFVGTPTQEKENRMKSYTVNLNQTMNVSKDIVIRFDPTSVSLNGETWSVDASEFINHSIVYRKKEEDFKISNLRIFSDESSILINGVFKSGEDFNSEIIVDNLELSKVLAFMPSENPLDIKGIANGRAEIKMNKKVLAPIIDIDIHDIVMNGEKVGNLSLDAQNSSTANIFDVVAKITSSELLGGNKMEVTGTINNTGATPTLDLSTKLNDFNIAFAGEFVKSIFSNLRGKANGEIAITGPLNDIDYSGNVAFSGLGFKFNFSGVDYSFEDAEIPISKGLVQLNDVKIKDNRSISSGSVSGIIRFETLASLGLDLIIRADNVLLLNTSQKDFDVFWGRVVAQGDIYINGPVTGLSIAADARVLGGSEFTLNTSTSQSVEEFKMLRFLKVNEETGEISLADKVKTGLNMTLALNLAVDKNSTVNVLVGDELGDISVRGNAQNLKFNMSRSGQMSMNGVYSVDNGTFLSKAILERTFQIQKGSSIAWDHDVMNPDLNIVANYYRVVSNLGEYLNVGRLQPTNVQLQVILKSKMRDIDPIMDIKLPDASSQIKEALTAKINVEDEKIKQIGSILVMNSFNTSTSMADVNLGSTAISTGYSMLFKNLSSVFNAISNDFQIDMDYIKGDTQTNVADRANTSVNIAVSPRLKIRTGIGVPISKTAEAQNNYLSGEGSIEYDISRQNDGGLVLHAYSKPANIGLVVGSNASANQSYGVGMVYTKSFNKLGDIFRSKKKKRKENKKDQHLIIKKDSVNK